MIAIWIASAVAAIIFIVGITLFNRLIRFKNTVKSAWSDIDVQLKKRHDLIPNLLETVKSYSAYEKYVFENITRARGAAMSGIAPGGRAEAEQALSGPLRLQTGGDVRTWAGRKREIAVPPYFVAIQPCVRP